MTLPELAPLAALSNKDLEKLRNRLIKVGLSAARLEAIARASAAVHPLLRRPIHAHHLRAIKEPWAVVARALVFGDPVDRAELESALGEAWSIAESSGLVRQDAGGGLKSPFSFAIVATRFLISDDLAAGPEAVMGLGPLTNSLVAAAMPRKKIGRVLDLGCGAGALALAFSKAAEKVVATDINPRAVEMAKLNVRLNAAFNVDVREGDLYAPAKDEKFDLLVSQPPFVPRPEGAAGGEFMSGGARGDEILRAVLEGASAHLAPRGTAVIAAEWGIGEGLDMPIDRVRAALGSSLVDAIVFQLSPTSADAHAIEYAAALHSGLGSDFEREALTRRAHCAAMKIEALAPTFVALATIEAGPARVDVLAAGSSGAFTPSSRRIQKLLAARDVVRALDRVLASRVRMDEKVVLREEQVGPGMQQESSLVAVLPPHAMSEPLRLDPTMLRLTGCLHESDTVKDGLDLFSERYRGSHGLEELLPLVVRALLVGLVELAD